MKYAVFFTDKPYPEGGKESQFEGLFQTIQAAENHIRRDAQRCLEGGLELPNDNWGGVYTIFEVVKAITPVPTVKITLKEVEE